jgi:hypothetical protein
MTTHSYTVRYLRDLPNQAQEGDVYYVDESKEYFTKPVCYQWTSGAWHIKYIT